MTNDIAEILKDKIAGLPFVDRITGLVKTLSFRETLENGSSKLKSYPIACNVTAGDCVNTGKYQDLVPNSSKKSVIYFEEAGGTIMTGVNGKLMNFRSNIRLVCWLNLKKMGLTDCQWSSTAVLQVIRELSDLITPANYDSKYIHLKVTAISEAEKSVAIFSRYTYDEPVNQYLIYPFDYFALNITIEFSVNKNCIQDAEIPDIELCDDDGSTVTTPDTTVGECWDLLTWDCDRQMWVRLHAGTAGYQLTTHGTTSAPTWEKNWDEVELDIVTGVNEVSHTLGAVPDIIQFWITNGTKTQLFTPPFIPYTDSADNPTTKIFFEAFDDYAGVTIKLLKFLRS